MQRFVDSMVADLDADAYMDDLSAGANSVEEFTRIWRTIFERFRAKKAYLSPSKTKLFRTSLEILGHRVEAQRGYSVLPSRAQEILSLKEPSNVVELQSVIGIFSYVAEVIPRFAHRALPLRALLNRCIEVDKGRRGGARPSNLCFPLQAEEKRAFMDLKSSMECPSFLKTFDPDRRTLIVSDASQAAVAAVLYQLHEDGPHVVAFFSKALQEAQSRWKVFDLEAFALTSAVRRWEDLLHGVPFVVVSDHRGLSALFKPVPDLRGKRSRWVADLLPFDIELRHASGESAQMALADYLSRNPNSSWQEAAVANWELAPVLASKPATPSATIRRIFSRGTGTRTSRGLSRWADKVKAKRLKSILKASVPKRIYSVLSF